MIINLFLKKIEQNQLVIQSNDMHHIDENINCVNSEEELINKHKIREVLYSGSQNIVEWHDEKIEECETLAKKMGIHLYLHKSNRFNANDLNMTSEGLLEYEK